MHKYKYIVCVYVCLFMHVSLPNSVSCVSAFRVCPAGRLRPPRVRFGFLFPDPPPDMFLV